MDLNTSNSTPSAQRIWQRDDRYSFLLTALVWTLVVLMIVPEGFDYAILSKSYAPAAGSKISRLLWLSLLSFSALFILWRAGLAWLLLRSLNLYFLIIVGLAIASVTWSIEPTLSVRRIVRMLTFVSVAIAFVLMAWHARRYQNVLRPILTIMLLGSIVFGLLFPDLAIHAETSAELLGAWHGLANHKNGLGALAGFALIFWFHAWLTREVKALPALTGLSIAGLCLVLSRSSTAMAATGFVLLFILLILRTPTGLRPYMPYFVAIFLIGLVLYALAILDLIPGQRLLLSPVTTLTGKDMTFTGRTGIWAILTEHIRSSPFFGSGYGAYWAGPIADSPSYEFIRRMGAFYPGSAHNGYLEILNDLGWAGLVALFAYMVTYVVQSLRLLSVDRNQAALYLALLVQQALTNLSETHWFSVLSVDFVIMALATTALARNLLEYRLRYAFGQPPPTRRTRNEALRPASVRRSLAP